MVEDVEEGVVVWDGILGVYEIVGEDEEVVVLAGVDDGVEVGVGEGEGVVMGEGLEIFWTMNSEAISTTTNKTPTRTSFTWRFRTCIAN